MNIKEQNVSVIIDSLTERIRQLEAEVWWREDKIRRLKEELAAKGGAENG